MIFKRYHGHGGVRLFTEISNDLSTEINRHYERLFSFFQARPEWVDKPLSRKMILNHLPDMLKEDSRLRARAKRLPPKIKAAILASEIATSIVYRGGWEPDFESQLQGFLKRLLS